MIGLVTKPKLLVAGATLIAFVAMGGYIAYLRASNDTLTLKLDQCSGQLTSCVNRYISNQEIMDELQENIDSNNRQFAADILRERGQCAKVTTTKSVDAEEGSGHVSENGLPLAVLRDYSRESNEIRLLYNSQVEWIDRNCQ